MAELLRLVLLAITLIPIAWAQQERDGRCDVTRQVVTYTRCTSCYLNEFISCPSGTVKTSTGQGLTDCSFIFIIFLRRGCRHSCTSTVVTEARCCDDYWGTNCDPCPGLDGDSGVCSGHGNCSSGIDGDGSCACEDSFNGTNCELCSEENMYGPECDSICTCANGECNSGISGDGLCQPDTCEMGFIGDNCDLEINTTACMNKICGNNSYCVESMDGNISCRCLPDHHLNPIGGIDCIAIDHCELDTHNCNDNATCGYTAPNQYNCTCDDGFTGDGVFCEAIDPCQINNGDCEENSSCIFEGPGLSSCECLEGYENMSVGCSPINPCEDGTANCSALANCSYEGPGIARCICPSGYVLSDGECYGSLLEQLVDINESTDYKLNTYLSVIEEQGLDDLLDRGGVFTLFVPTDTAFEQTMLTFDASITLLAHIIPAEVESMVSVLTNYVTLAGHSVEITPDNNYTVMDSTVSAGIVASNFIAYNGFINILDDISIIPQSARPFNVSTNSSAWNLINTWDRLSTFSSLIQLANMVYDFELSNITVLAPTNEAFEALEPGAIAYLQSVEGINDLITIIGNHLLNEEISITGIVMQRTLETAENNSYPVTLNPNGSISLGDVKLIINNIAVSNGVVHVIDAVLKPPELDPIVNRNCPLITVDIFRTTCGSCRTIPVCPPQYERSIFSTCFTFFVFHGCRRTCSRDVITPRCCDGFYGTDCLPCPEHHANPCNGNGQCQDGIDGDGTCLCDDNFNGTTCELCAEDNKFGDNCTQDCTCINGICDTGPMGSGQCIPGSCDEGFIGDNCEVGIPHCGILNSTCHLYATCRLINNTETCTCRYGYQGDGILNCQPINRCQDLDRGGCHDQANCTYDSPGEFTCTCNAGWSGDGLSCVAIDPCTLPQRGGCDSNAVCHFTAPGENTCACNFGYRGDGTSCTAINSCEVDRGFCHPQATCIYTGPGTNNCTCNPGYIGDGYNCMGHLLDEIGNNPNVSEFYRLLLQETHLDALLAQSDNDIYYTVFVPSNAAMSRASTERLAIWTEEHTLPLLIQHLIVARKYYLENLKSHLGSLPTLLADDVLTVTNVSINGNNTVHINTAGIVISDLFAQNGVYHIVDELLFPSDAHLHNELPLIVDLLSNLSNHTVLVELINRFNFTDILNSNTFTILAPTNDAFSFLSEDELSNLTVNDLLYHVYPGSLPFGTIYKGLQLYSQLANAGPLTFDVNGNSATVNGIPLLGNDYQASNSSVVLPIAGILQPIFNRCDVRNVSRINGLCSHCFSPQDCPPGTTSLVIERSCTYRLVFFGLSIILRGCRHLCEQVDITPRCCDGFYGPDCDACPQVDGDICSERGSCNDTVTGNGQCLCAGNYSGTACETCQPNLYGEECNQVCNCSANGRCNDGVDGDGSCFCLPGWQGDRCDILVNSTVCNSICLEFAYCIEANRTCVCAEGYTGNGTHCAMINPCVDNGGCALTANCLPNPFAPSGRTCTCQPERYTGDGIVCLPLDPCLAANKGGCDRNAKCVMTGPGLRTCVCNAGYSGDGVRSCDAINACELTINGGCGANAYCLPAGPAQKKCFCNENFVGDGYTCSGTLRQVITSHPSLTTLNSYLNKTTPDGLPIGRFLNNDGRFTGFAISDDGYRALMNSSSNDTLSLFSNPDALEKLIQYSFVSCTVHTVESLENVSNLTSLMGSTLNITNSSSGVRVNNIDILEGNLIGANGIVHIIDTAVMPPSADLILGSRSDDLSTVLSANRFTYLRTGIQMAGSTIVQELFNPSQAPFTIFAPVDRAFSAQLITFFTGLFLTPTRTRLINFVEYHMVSGATLSPSDLSSVTHLVTVQGGVIRIQCNQGDLYVNDRRVVLRQIPFDLGILYGIDGILRPPGEGGDCDVDTTLSAWTNCSLFCVSECPGGYTPVNNATSQQGCDLQNGMAGCRKLCIRSSFERRCCDSYYGSDCTACPMASNLVCSGVVSCDDGIDGVGCNCPPPYSGEACEGCTDGYSRNSSLCVPVPTTTSLSIVPSTTATISTTTTTAAATTITSTATSPSMTSSTMATSTSSLMPFVPIPSSILSSPAITTSSTVMTSSVMTSSVMTSSLTTSSNTISLTNTSMSLSLMTSSLTTSSSTISLTNTSMSSSLMTSSLTTSSSTITTSFSSIGLPSPTSTSTSSMVSLSMTRPSGSISQPSSTTITSLSVSEVSTITSPSIKITQSAGASEEQKSNSTGMAVGVSIGVVILIVIVIVVVIIVVYVYSKKRGYFSFKDRMTYKSDEDGIILTMNSPTNSPSPSAYNNPIYSIEGDDTFFGSDDYMTNPIYDGMDDEL